MAEFTLETAGRSIDTILADLKGTQLTNADKGILVSSWIFKNFGDVLREFNYSLPLAPSAPLAVPTFQRSFVHQDWIDGESVVQAGSTTGEQGFNLRLHRIEDDFDKLAADVALAFTTVAELRRQLSTLLAEVRAELNRLNGAVHNLQNRGSTIGPLTAQPPAFGQLLDKTAFLGATKFLGKDVTVWNTNQGTVMLPVVSPAAINTANIDRVNAAPNLERFITERRVDVGEGPITKTTFAEKFGDERLADGQLVRNVVDILPANASFANATELVDAVAERQAAVVRTSGESSAVITSLLGSAPATTNVAVAETSVTNVTVIPPEVSDVLSRNGVGSVGALAERPAAEIVDIASRNGLTVSLSQAALWSRTAKTLRMIR